MTIPIPYELRDDLYRRPLAAALERLGDMTGFRCVDVGAGGGDVSVALAEVCGERGRIYAVDIDPVRRNQIAARASRFSQVVALTQAAEELTLPEPVDLAFCRFLLLAVAEPGLVVERMVAATRPGGWVIIQEPITSAGRIGRRPLSMEAPGVHDPDIGAAVLELLRTRRVEVRDAWIESPAGIGDTAVARYLEAMSETLVTEEQIILPPLLTAIAKVL
ncbi:MAG: class I SAM-dependent methyltransferase [Actinomycetota bacterium]|nr:class I SAM-dependent methyltransferase [Actinomycetota bacterium]